jgi:hypothetical protein
MRKSVVNKGYLYGLLRTKIVLHKDHAGYPVTPPPYFFRIITGKEKNGRVTGFSGLRRRLRGGRDLEEAVASIDPPLRAPTAFAKCIEQNLGERKGAPAR